MTKFKLNPIASALGITLAATIAASPIAQADQNPFGVSEMSSGYMLAGADEGKCGDDMKDKEGKCGEGMSKGKEGKCGEGKCGENKGKAKAKDAEGKCGEEGKCGDKE
ncbi:MAG TPA: hypothetical protein VFX02_11235 [Gammaproteobacteria bacterium]|nr:hypothetical protein [Gammaproteobacteria bacterium]